MLRVEILNHVLHKLFGLSKGSSFIQQLNAHGVNDWFWLKGLLTNHCFDFKNYEFELYNILILREFIKNEGWNRNQWCEILTIDRTEWLWFCQEFFRENKDNKIRASSFELFDHCLPSFVDMFTMRLKCRYAMSDLMRNDAVLSTEVNCGPLLKKESNLNEFNNLLGNLGVNCEHLRDIPISLCDAVPVENSSILDENVDELIGSMSEMSNESVWNFQNNNIIAPLFVEINCLSNNPVFVCDKSDKSATNCETVYTDIWEVYDDDIVTVGDALPCTTYGECPIEIPKFLSDESLHDITASWDDDTAVSPTECDGFKPKVESILVPKAPWYLAAKEQSALSVEHKGGNTSLSSSTVDSGTKTGILGRSNFVCTSLHQPTVPNICSTPENICVPPMGACVTPDSCDLDTYHIPTSTPYNNFSDFDDNSLAIVSVCDSENSVDLLIAECEFVFEKFEQELAELEPYLVDDVSTVCEEEIEDVEPCMSVSVFDWCQCKPFNISHTDCEIPISTFQLFQVPLFMLGSDICFVGHVPWSVPYLWYHSLDGHNKNGELVPHVAHMNPTKQPGIMSMFAQLCLKVDPNWGATFTLSPGFDFKVMLINVDVSLMRPTAPDILFNVDQWKLVFGICVSS
jgi:hypothetical protein